MASASSLDVTLPAELHHLTPVRKLGSGSYGEVLLAYDQQTRQLVALKRMSCDANNANSYFNTYTANHEFDVMQCLVGESGFAQLHYALHTPSSIYFCMKYYTGGSLSDLVLQLLDTKNKWSFSTAQRFAAQLVVMVAKLHCRGVIHRDIKPDNLLLDQDGTLVLSDFGLSRRMDLSQPVHKQVCLEQFDTRHMYMAPEMLRQQATCHSYPVDVFSVGATISFLCMKQVQDNSWTAHNQHHAWDVHQQLTRPHSNSRPGLSHIARHSFFQGIQWNELMNTNHPSYYYLCHS